MHEILYVFILFCTGESIWLAVDYATTTTFQRTGLSVRANRCQKERVLHGLNSIYSFLAVFSPSCSLPIWWPVGSRDHIISCRFWDGLNCWCPPANSCSMASPFEPCNFIPKLKGEQEWIKLLFFSQPSGACSPEFNSPLSSSLQLQRKFFWSFS